MTIGKRSFTQVSAAFLVLISVVVAELHAEIPTNALSIAIAIPANNRSGHELRTIRYYRPDSHFHVIIRNESAEPQKIWLGESIFGRAALSFEMTDSKGQTLVVHPTLLKHFSSGAYRYCILATNETMVMDVLLGTDLWREFPLPKNGRARYTVVAVYRGDVYEVGHDEGMWTGEIRSVPLQVLVECFGVKRGGSHPFNIPPELRQESDFIKHPR